MVQLSIEEEQEQEREQESENARTDHGIYVEYSTYTNIYQHEAA